MKLFSIVLLMLLGIAQLNWAQETVKPRSLNTMSNVIGITAEGGITMPFTDYSTSTINYNIKGALEYFKGTFNVVIYSASTIISKWHCYATFSSNTNYV